MEAYLHHSGHATTDYEAVLEFWFGGSRDDARRVFFYLPLEHSESIEDQERSVMLYRALCQEVPPSQVDAFVGFLGYAERHRDVILRFGRFPHRNAILGRPSTDEEIEFLKQPGSSF